MPAQRSVVVAAMVMMVGCGAGGDPLDPDAGPDAGAVDADPADAADGDGPELDAAPDADPDAADAGMPDAPPPPPDQVARVVLGFGAEPAEGGRPPMAGVAAFLDDDRAVFADQAEGSGLVLSVVDVGGARARVVDQALLDVAMDRFFGGSDWSDRFLTHVVPLAPDRVAVVGTRQRVELFAVGDRLTPLARVALDSRDDSLLDAVGRGDTLWVCSGRFLRRFKLTDDAIAELPAAAVGLPAGTCRSLALSPDGRTLWVAGTGGIASYDPTTTPATLTRHLLARQGFARVVDEGTWLTAQTLLPYGDLGGVQVFRVGDLPDRGDPAPVARFDPVTRDDLWSRPLGVGLVAGKLAVETLEVTGATRRYRLDLHPWTAGGPGPPSSTLTLRQSDEVGLHASPLPLVGRGRHLIAQPWRRIVRVSDSMDYVSGPHHGAFDAVWSTGAGAAVALGPFSLHPIGLGAGAPALVGGGHDLPASTSRLRLVRRDGGWQLVAATIGRPNIVQEPGPAHVSCLVPAGDSLALAGTVTIPAGDAGSSSLLAVAGDRLFQLSRPTASSYRLRRFRLPGRCEGQALIADVDHPVDIGGGAGTRIGWSLAVAPAGDALLAVETVAAPPPGPISLHLAWLAGDDLAVVARGKLGATTADPSALAITGPDAALLVENGRHVHQLAIAGGAITATTTDVAGRGLAIASVLAITGDVAYVGTVSRPLGVLALRLTDLAALGHCATPTPPRSIAFAGPDVVVGMTTALAVCRGARSDIERALAAARR
jgi:hypothetical protein